MIRTLWVVASVSVALWGMQQKWVAAPPGVQPLETAVQPTELIAVDLDQADVHSVVRLFSHMLKRNIAIARGCDGKVTLHLKGVTPQQAFQLFLEQKGLYARDYYGVILVFPLERA